MRTVSQDHAPTISSVASGQPHTPGPWRVTETHTRYIQAEGHLGPLAELRSRLDYPGMDPRVAQTLDANARLMAAAPELLEALKLIPQSSEWSSMESDTQAAVLAALAKV